MTTTRPARRRGNGQGTLFKRTGRGPWIARWYDHEGKRQERPTRTTDKTAAERILRKGVADVALRRDGVIDFRAEAESKQAQRPIGQHLAAWRASLQAKGNSPKRISMTKIGGLIPGRRQQGASSALQAGCGPRDGCPGGQ